MCVDAQEERKEKSAARLVAESFSSGMSQEEYDDFDGDAVRMGDVNIAAILASESAI